MQKQAITLDDLNKLRDRVMRDRAMNDSAVAMQVPYNGNLHKPAYEAMDGLPDHFGSLPQQDMGGIEPELNSAPNTLGGHLGLYVDELERDALRENELRQQDPRSPFKKMAEYIVDGAPEYEGAGRSLADDLSPYLGMMRFAKEGADATIEGYNENNPAKTIGGMGMVALSALPASSKVREAMGTVKGTLGTALGVTLAPELAYGTLGDAIAGTVTDEQVKAMETRRDDLLGQKQGLLKRRLPDNGSRLTSAQISALQRQLGQKVDGQWGRDTQAAINQFNAGIDDKLNLLETELSQYTPTAIAEFKRAQSQKDKELADANEAAFWDRPTQEIAPWLSPALTFSGAVGSAALGRYLGRKNADKINQEISDLSKRWAKAISDAKDPSDLLKAEQGARAARHYGAELDKLQKMGVDPGMKAHIAAAVATDLGAASPEIVDLLRGRSPEADYEEFTKRLLYSTMMGGGASKLAAQTAQGRLKPVRRFDPETKALDSVIEHRGGPQGYYKKFNDGAGVDVEDSFRKRRALRQLEDLRQEARQERRSTPEGRRALLETQSRQEQQTQRQQSQDQSSSSRGSSKRQPESSTDSRRRQTGNRPHPNKKRSAVLSDIEAGKSVKAVAKKHKVPERTVYEWKREGRRMKELEELRNARSPQLDPPRNP